MQAEQQLRRSNRRRYRRYRRKTLKGGDEAATKHQDDLKYPDKRLDVILKGLEERVHAEKENLYRLQSLRNDLEFEFNGLQTEKLVLDQSLAEAKQCEAFVREKERQINEEFNELSDERRKPDVGPLIQQTLLLGRELFSLLLRDATIEETSRKAFQARVARIEAETMKKAEERNQLQDRVLELQKACEADLEQKRHIYDEIQALQKRRESVDAQIGMLTEWKNSLEYQITAVRAAIKQRQNHVSDSVASTPPSTKDDESSRDELFEDPSVVHFSSASKEPISSKEEAPPFTQNDIFAKNVYKNDEATSSPQNDEESLSSSIREDLSQDVLIDGKNYTHTCPVCGGQNCDPVFGHQTACVRPANVTPLTSTSQIDLSSVSVDCIAFASCPTTSAAGSQFGEDDEVHVEADFEDARESILGEDDTQPSDSEDEEDVTSPVVKIKAATPQKESHDFLLTSSDTDEGSESDSSYLTVRTSRSVLHALSSPSSSEPDSDGEPSAPFEKVLDKLRNVRDMSIPKQPESTSMVYEVWRQVLPNEAEDPKNNNPKAKKSSK